MNKTPLHVRCLTRIKQVATWPTMYENKRREKNGRLWLCHRKERKERDDHDHFKRKKRWENGRLGSCHEREKKETDKHNCSKEERRREWITMIYAKWERKRKGWWRFTHQFQSVTHTCKMKKMLLRGPILDKPIGEAKNDRPLHISNGW